MLKRFLPTSLFGRALLILALPMALMQLVTGYIFFDRHWDNVSRHMSSALSGEVAFLVGQMRYASNAERAALAGTFSAATGIQARFERGHSTIGRERASGEYPNFVQFLQERIPEAFSVRALGNEDAIEILVRLKGGVLHLQASSKRLESTTTTIFLLWMIGSSAILLFIAVLFLRNQIRPIRKLAEAAESFGRGRELPGFRPSGATEVRRAARAFIVMKERIKRQVRTRTEMLAGISHDLRTPLTRMKLQLALLPDTPEIRELGGDVAQMEHMIQEYLDFARGAGREETTRVLLSELLEDVARSHRRMEHDVQLGALVPAEVALRGGEIRRVMHNLVDNAVRYGKRCLLSSRVGTNYVEVLVDDEGPGIPEQYHEEVFKPFTRLDSSRNAQTGGVGLGLAIARDIVLGHGGDITLATAPSGGLRVVVRLPV